MKRNVTVLLRWGIFIGVVFFYLSGPGLKATEIGLTAGMESNESHFTYGLSGSFGFLLPVLELEVEGYRMTGTGYNEMPGGLTCGVKFRPNLGLISPYGVVGVGAEMESIDFDFGEMEKYTFIGGGIYYKVVPVIALRADIRFLNFSGYNRLRLTGGVFIHF